MAVGSVSQRLKQAIILAVLMAWLKPRPSTKLRFALCLSDFPTGIVRMPCGYRGGVDGVGVLRLRLVFAILAKTNPRSG